MNLKERIKALERLAQSAASTGTQGAQTGTQGTGQGAQTSVQPPQRSPAASTLFPAVTIGWDSSRVPYVNRIVSMLDIATGIGTNGRYNFKILWDNKFPAGTDSEFASPVKDLLILFRRVYLQFLNNGVNFQKPLNTGEIIQRVNAILNAPEITKLEQINQAGPLGKAGVSLANLRQTLMNMLPAAR
jgi:hypothetical protein